MSQEKPHNYALIEVVGTDAVKFLQGQLTCDVQHTPTDNFILGAHCNAQGRIMSLFRLFKQDENHYLLMPTEVIEAALTTLKKYAIFSKVKLAIKQINEIKPLPFEFDDTTQHAKDINQGIPRLYPNTIGEFLPHYLNLPELNAVSFTKGCYTGQEIIARMQHRGKLKQKMILATLAEYHAPGSKIIEHHQEIGVGVDLVASENQQYTALVIVKDKAAE